MDTFTLDDFQSQNLFFQEVVETLVSSSYQIDTSENTWECWSCGTGEQVIVLFHGGMSSPEMWFYVAHELMKNYRVILPRTPDRLSSVLDIIEFFKALLERENKERAIVVGYSFGGGIAQILVDQIPEKVSCVVLSHTGTMWGRKPNKSRKLRLLIRLIPTSLFRKIFLKKRVQAFPDSKWDRFHQVLFTDTIMNLQKRTMFDFMDSAVSVLTDFNNSESRLDQYHGPVILLGTEGDTDAFDAMSIHHERFQRISEHVFTGSGGHHYLFLHPEEYTTKLLSLLG